MEFNQLSFIINEHQIMKNEKRNLFFQEKKKTSRMTAAIKIPDHFKTNNSIVTTRNSFSDLDAFFIPYTRK